MTESLPGGAVISQTPEARQAEARAKIAAREQAIKANGVKQGIEQERKRNEQANAVMAASHAAALEASEEAYRKAAATAHRAGHAHGFWKGAALGAGISGALVLIGAAWYGAQVINPAFDAAARFQMQQGVVDRLDRQVNPPAPNYPSEAP